MTDTVDKLETVWCFGSPGQSAREFRHFVERIWEMSARCDLGNYFICEGADCGKNGPEATYAFVNEDPGDRQADFQKLQEILVQWKVGSSCRTSSGGFTPFK